MKKIVIIGGGPAGLTAALKLAEKNNEYSITVLEKSNALGGISRTVEHNGNRMDIGGHRFFTKSEEVKAVWDEILKPQCAPSKDELLTGEKNNYPENGQDPEIYDNVMLERRRVSRILYNGKFFDYPVSLSFSTIKNLGFFSTVAAGFSYLWACVRKRKENNLEDFYINRFGKKLYRTFFESYTEKVWGRKPSEISADWGRQRVKGVSIRAVLKNMFVKAFGGKQKNIETSLIDKFYYPKFGPGQLYESMAKQALTHENVKIIMGAECIGLDNADGKITKVIYKKDGNKFEIPTDEVISSMPLNELYTSLNGNDAELQRIADGLPFRDFITVGFLVEKIKLENKTKIKTPNGIVPDCWLYVQDNSVKVGRIQIFNNWSPYLVKDFPEKIWLSLEYFSSGKDELWNMSENELVEFAKAELNKLNIIEKDGVLDYKCEKVEKAYCAYFDTYNEIDKLKNYFNGFENLFCVGRNGQHRYNNMDHSMLTAIEAVKVICGETADKTAIWNVNTETEYHETIKKEPKTKA